MPSGISAISAPLDQNLVSMPHGPSEPGSPVDGWVVRVGDKRHQAVSVTLRDGDTAFHIMSRHAEDSIEIISPRIRVRPDMGITIAGLVKRSEDFQGNVALACRWRRKRRRAS